MLLLTEPSSQPLTFVILTVFIKTSIVVIISSVAFSSC